MRLRALPAWVALLVAACAGGDGPSRAPELNRLSSRGLYRDIDKREIVSAAFEYTPEFGLWSDGAQKRRWMILPKGEHIGTQDLAHWDFPLGTKLFKEFSLDGVLLETRLIERVKTTGRVKEDFFMGTFVWRADQRDAVLEVDGHDDVNGTEHDVPAQKYCIVCHAGEPSAILGMSAVQLSASGALETLSERGLLSEPVTRGYALGGDAVQRAALGTLHANCGHCHAQGGAAEFMQLRVLPEQVDGPIEELDAYRALVGVELSDEWKDRPERFTTRVVPGEPEQSAIVYRMEQRGDDELVPDQMPPLATRKVDEDGVAAVRAWIAALPVLADAGPGERGDDAGRDGGVGAGRDAGRPALGDGGSALDAGDAMGGDAAASEPDGGVDAGPAAEHDAGRATGDGPVRGGESPVVEGPSPAACSGGAGCAGVDEPEGGAAGGMGGAQLPGSETSGAGGRVAADGGRADSGVGGQAGVEVGAAGAGGHEERAGAGAEDAGVDSYDVGAGAAGAGDEDARAGAGGGHCAAARQRGSGAGAAEDGDQHQRAASGSGSRAGATR